MAASDAPSVLTFSPPVSRRRTKQVTSQKENIEQETIEQADDVRCTYQIHEPSTESVALLERIGRLEGDKDVLQQRVKQLSATLDATEREAAIKEERLRASLAQALQQQRTLEAEKAELTKELSVLQHRDNQYLHETRKKERELEKIQKKLQSALSERGVKDTRGIETHAVRNGVASKVAPPVDLQQRTINSLEERVTSLTIENDSLRKALQDLIDHSNENAPTNSTTADATENLDSMTPIVLPPLDRTEDLQQLRTQLWQRITRLKENLKEFEASKEEIQLGALQVQVNELRRIIVEQEQLLQFSLVASSNANAVAAAAGCESAWPSPVLKSFNQSPIPDRKTPKSHNVRGAIVSNPPSSRRFGNVDQENKV